MPTPLDQSEMRPSAGQMPPHYEDMETPGRQEPTPATMPPMDPTNPMPEAAPMGKQPIPAPMPAEPEAMRTPSTRFMVPTTMQQGVIPQGGSPYIDSRHQTNNLRL
jgi:hypothetical protein